MKFFKLNLKETIKSYIRVLRLAKKPSYEDFVFISKICLIGMFAVGLIGFILYLISALFL